MQLRKLSFNGNDIEYALYKKKVKNINLRIKVDGSVSVSAGPRVSVKRVDEFVLSRADYIIFHVNRFKKMKKPQPKNYIHGEFFTILGKKIRLEVIRSEQELVFFDGEKLILNVRDINDFYRKEKLINRFFNHYCEEYLGAVVNNIYPTFKQFSISFPIIKYRSMKTRWGSCAVYKKQITLNKKLIKAPKECIEYVVLHEFAHFIHPNHSKQFYSFVENLMPDYKERKKLLEQFSA